jgi:hypothetical protein
MTGQWWFQRENERLLWEGSPRWSAAISGVAVAAVIVAVALVAAATIDPRLAAVSPLGLALGGWQLLRVRHTSYLVTNRAVWQKRGVVGRRVRRVGMPQVQNTAYSQSVTGSVFGYGTVTLDVAGGRDLTFRRIDDPERIRAIITDRIERSEPELPGTTDQWRAVLSVVRDLNTAIE